MNPSYSARSTLPSWLVSAASNRSGAGSALTWAAAGAANARPNARPRVMHAGLIIAGPSASDRVPLAVGLLAGGAGGLVHLLPAHAQPAPEVSAHAAVGHLLGVQRDEIARLVGARV